MTLPFEAVRKAIDKNRKLAEAYLRSLDRASSLLNRFSALKRRGEVKKVRFHSDLFDIKLPPEIRFEVETNRRCAEVLCANNLPQEKPPVTVRLLFLSHRF